jgi:hypothetical protein
MKNIIISVLAFIFFSSCCNLYKSKDKSTFLEIHQKVYQDDVELIFRIFLFKYGRFPINISEITDSAQNDSSFIKWVSLKMEDPFSLNNEPLKYLSFNKGGSFLLLSRGPDHKFNQYEGNSSLTSILNSPYLLVDSECTDKTSFRETDIIVMYCEAKSVLISNSKIIDNVSAYFDEMIAQNKRYTFGIKQVLLYIEPKIHIGIISSEDSVTSYIDIVYNGYTFRFLLPAHLNSTTKIVEKLDQNFTVSGVYSSYDEDHKIFLYEHCICETMKPLEVRNYYLEQRKGSVFDINRCNLSSNRSTKH